MGRVVDSLQKLHPKHSLQSPLFCLKGTPQQLVFKGVVLVLLFPSTILISGEKILIPTMAFKMHSRHTCSDIYFTAYRVVKSRKSRVQVPLYEFL